MAQFELTLNESFRRNQDSWPHEFRSICDGLVMALAYLADKTQAVNSPAQAGVFYGAARFHVVKRNVSREPLTSTIRLPQKSSVFTGTIAVADEVAAQFEAAFRAIPDVVRVQHVA